MASHTQTLSKFLGRPVGPADRQRACLHVLDWFGCAIAGAASTPGQKMHAALEVDANGAVPLLGHANTGSAHSAALYHGALGNVLEMDDVDRRAILHPGPVVIPAALALAIQSQASAEAFLDAIVRGYEAVIRLGRAVGKGHYAYWHNTGTCGPFGAAAACASVLGLNPTQMAHALGLAGTQASGFWQTRHEPQSLAKQLHTARAAHAGVLSAGLAQQGFDGPLEILEGPQGFFAATCPDGDPAQVISDPDADWALHEVSFKPWPACRHAHPTIDAALEAQTGLSTDPTAITIGTYRDAINFCDKPNPQTPLEAKFSLQHCVAICCIKGRPALADFEPELIDHPKISALRAKVRVVEDDDLSAAYPNHYGARVTLIGQDGSKTSALARDAWGDPENPLSDDDLIAKAMTLMDHAGMTERPARALSEAVLGLTNAESLNNLIASMPRTLGGAS